jgi:hypothetical protein
MNDKQLVSELTVDEFKKVVTDAVADEIHRLINEAVIIEDGFKVSILPDKEDDIPLKHDFETDLLNSLKEANEGDMMSLNEFRKNRAI